MRKFLTIIFLVSSSASFFAQGTQKTFTLHDGELDSGSVMRRYDIFFDFNKATLRPEDSIVLDSIADWIILHPEFTIEVGNHTDYVPPSYSYRLTPARAKSVCDYLVAHSVPAHRVIPKGYGDVKNIIPQSVIAKETSKAKKDSLQRINRRTEFKIYRIDARLIATFTLQDSIFWPGQVLRDHGKILYDLNHSGMRPESKAWLDTIVLFMKQHPGIKIEVGSHTDSRGAAPYNIKLSEARARSVADYLVSQGIDASRVRAKGFGEMQPLRTDKEIQEEQTKPGKEALYQQNRRTEFKIISVR